MKRNQFLKNTLVFASGSFLLSCKNELISDFLSLESTDSPNVNDAKNWFQNVYLKELDNANSRINENNKKYKRIANWDKAKKTKDLKKQECIIVPINYETPETPGFMMWDESTSYKKELTKYYAQPIIESLVVYKEKGQYYSFLIQISYDRYNIKKKNNSIDFDKLTGFILKADYNDNIIDGAKLIDGKVAGTFSSTKNAKVQSCFTVSTSYTTVSVSSCGSNCYEVNFTLHTSSQMYCFNDSGDFYQSVLPADLVAGGSGYNPTYEYVRTFNPKNAVCQPGSSDRAVMNENLKDALFATGLAADAAGFSFDKAETLVRSIGGNMKYFKGIVNGVGIVGVAIDTVQLGIGVWDGNLTFEEDGLNAIQLSLGIVGLAAGGWIAVAAGAVTIGISIYAESLDGQPVCQ